MRRAHEQRPGAGVCLHVALVCSMYACVQVLLYVLCVYVWRYFVCPMYACVNVLLYVLCMHVWSYDEQRAVCMVKQTGIASCCGAPCLHTCSLSIHACGQNLYKPKHTLRERVATSPWEYFKHNLTWLSFRHNLTLLSFRHNLTW